MNETISYRVLDIFASLIQNQPNNQELFQLVVERGFIRKLLDRFQNDDLLERLNVIEMLQKFAASTYAINFFEKVDLMSTLSKLLLSQDVTIQNLLLPPLISLFGNISLVGEENLKALERIGIFTIFLNFVKKDEITKDMKVTQTCHF